MSELENISLIDRYLSGQMSEEEESLFQKRLKADEEFQALFEEIKLIPDAMMLQKKRQLLEHLDKIDTKPTTLKPTRFNPFSPKNKIGWYAAASIALVFMVRLLFMSPSTDSLALFEEYYEVYPNLEHPIKRGVDDGDSIEIKAFHEYELGNYQSSIELFTTLKNDSSNVSNFYQGNCYLALDKPLDAITYYDKISDSTFLYYNQLTWYKGLSYLHLDKLTEAKSSFKILILGKSSYSLKAQEILQEMN